MLVKFNEKVIPHRPSRGSTRGALTRAGIPLASGEKLATVDQVSLNTSRAPGKIAGGVRKREQSTVLRIGTVNVGSMKERDGEVADMAARRRLDICCLQETRYKGGSAKTIGHDDGWYKFFWVGCEEGVSGVGVLVAGKWIDNVVEVKRASERVIVLRLAMGKTVLNVVSVYAPQVGRTAEEKEEFYILLGKVLKEVGTDEKLIVCGDLNGHVGAEADGFEGVHGGNGFGARNVEGEMLLEFADATGMVVCNTWFTKKDSQKITYESGGFKTMVDYILVRKEERRTVRNVTVIQSEACIKQHKLMISVILLDDQVKKKKEVFESKCRVWKLKEEEIHMKFKEKFQSKAESRVADNVESLWKTLKDSLLNVADEVCGRTKGPPRHRVTWWWNDDVAKAVDEKRRRFRIWKKSKTENDRASYCLAKRNACRAVYVAKSDEQRLFGETVDKAFEKGTVFRIAKQIVAKNRDVVGAGCVKEIDGKVVTDKDKVKERWKNYFEKLLNEEFEWDKADLSTADKVCGEADTITFSEVKSAIARTKSNKAAGPSGVVAEMLKASGDVGIQWVTDLCNKIVQEGKIPSDWRKSWMVKVYKGKGDALECGSYRGIKLLDHAMKVLERVIENRVKSKVCINDMQFGFRSGRGTTDAIFIVRQIQERFLEKKKDLWMAFIDLEKAFDRVPREVVWWALRRLGVEEWLVKVIRAMYEGVTTAVKMNDGESGGIEVKVGLHQGSVLSPLLFIIVLEALSTDFRAGLPWELFYADDLCLIAETEEKLMVKIRCWKKGMESKGLRVNMSKTKVMCCKVGAGQVEKTGKWPCGVCRKGVGVNSILCTKCKQWVHKRCSGISARLNAAASDFRCKSCVEGIKGGEEKSEMVIENVGNLEYVNKFCYLGDMIGAGGGADEASRARVRCAWSKFRELSPLLTSRGVSLKVKGRLYSACVQSVMIYGSETWPMKLETLQRLERTEKMMIRWMCGVTLKDRNSSVELRNKLGIMGVSDIVRQGRLRWFGHVERKDAGDWVSACRDMVVTGKRDRGRGKKTWKECVADDMKKLKLKREDAHDRAAWRGSILGNRPTRASAETRT